MYRNKSYNIQKPRFTIIMPVYNEEENIANSIKSIICQTYKSFELIIIDDGSTDNTPDILSQFSDLPKIKLIRQKNAGTAAARNHGLQLASGQYICFLDGDDKYSPDRLEVINNYLEDNSFVKCLVTNYAIWNGRKLSEPILKEAPGKITRHGLPNALFPSLVFHFDVFDKIGLFDTKFYYIEDVDMWCRLHIHGYHVDFVDHCSYYYNRYGENNKTSQKNSKEISKDVIKIDMKYMLYKKQKLHIRFLFFKWFIGNIKNYILNFVIFQKHKRFNN
ncbi:glycosyltransferase [Candidatus Poribacteria bacterium]|nr:glycosyltransferase [Candidatus Poribacteria bacterium]